MKIDLLFQKKLFILLATIFNQYSFAQGISVGSGNNIDLGGNNIFVAGGIYIESGSSFSQDNSNITLTGNWSNSGNFLSGTGNLTFNGSSNQTIYSSGNSFNNVLISKNKGSLFLNTDIVISGFLNIENSIIDLNNHNLTISNKMEIEAGNTVFGNSGSISVNGNVFIKSGAILKQNSTDLSLSGSWNNVGIIHSGTGSLIFNGTTNQTLISTENTYHDIQINKSSGILNINNNLTVDGTLSVIKGKVDLNGKDITLTNTGLLSENGENKVYGSSGNILATKNLSANDNSNFAGLGIMIASESALNNITVSRGHKELNVNGEKSIERYYDISPYNYDKIIASIKVYYDESELNGLTESDLRLYSSTDHSNWNKHSTLPDRELNTLAVNRVKTFSRWTAAANIDSSPILAKIEADSLFFNEGDSAKFISSTIELTDDDSSSIKGAIILISRNYTVGKDTLLFENKNGITGVFQNETGRLILSGINTPEYYQYALHSVRYLNTSETIDSPSKELSIVVFDNTSGSDTLTRRIIYKTINDSPIIANLETSSLSYTENGSPIKLTETITLSDIDNSNINGASIAVSTGQISNEDLLSFKNQSNIVGNFNESSGILILSGSATVEDYQKALRSVTYSNSSENPTPAIKELSLSINDNSLSSDTLFRSVNITAVNDAPLITNIETTPLYYSENDPPIIISSNIKLNDLDDTNIAEAIILIKENYCENEDMLNIRPQNGIFGTYYLQEGKLVLNGISTIENYQTALRSVTYSNNSENPSILERVVQFTINDGELTSNTSECKINVASIINLPILSNIEGTAIIYNENDPAVQITSSIDISDDNVSLTSSQVQISNNYVKGEDVLMADTTIISGSFDNETGIMTFTGSNTIEKYKAVLHSVKYLNISDNPSNSERTITFNVNDGDGISNLLSRNLSVININDIPTVAKNTGFEINEGDVIVLSGEQLSATDIESEDQDLIFTLTQFPVHGILKLSGSVIDSNSSFKQMEITSGHLSYTHDGSEAANDFFKYIVQDGDSLSNTETIFSITINNINDKPIVSSLPALEFNEDEEISFSVTNWFDYIDDPDNADSTLVFSCNYSGEKLNTEIINNGVSLLCSAEENWCGCDSLTIYISDGTDTVTTLLSVNILPVNDLPEFNGLPDSITIENGKTFQLDL
ncbi:MAG: hypothetical protein JEY94_19010 [Melioribacteraceae bacterium]|nr:hypothetical protein [Melioribacteraceae bacterium]